MHSRLVLQKVEPKKLQLKRLVEAWPRRAGEALLHIDPSDQNRILAAESEAQGLRCQIRMADGRRVNNCQIMLPKKMSADLQLHYPPGPWRALAYTADKPMSARWRWGLSQKENQTAKAAQAQQLSGNMQSYAIETKHDSLLRIDGDSGICALFSGPKILAVNGMGRGCKIEYFVPAGHYRIQLRSFARQPLRGALTWTSNPVQKLSEGLGPETWIAPNTNRYSIFTVASKGNIGLGLQSDSDRLSCRILNLQHKIMGEGCQQLTDLEAGRYLIEVSAPDDGQAQSFKAVILGIEGGDRGVPKNYLKNFFKNLGDES